MKNNNRVGTARRRNRKTGSGLIEGVAGLWLLLSGTTLAVLLLVNSGLAAYYKEKLAGITYQAANYAANRISGPNSPGVEAICNDTKTQVDNLLKSMGLPQAKDIDIKVSKNQVAVTVAVQGLGMIGQGDILPAAISLSDTGCALIDNTRPKFVTEIMMTRNGTGVCCLVPCFVANSFSGTYQASNISHSLGATSLPLKATMGCDGLGSIFKNGYDGRTAPDFNTVPEYANLGR